MLGEPLFSWPPAPDRVDGGGRAAGAEGRRGASRTLARAGEAPRSAAACRDHAAIDSFSADLRISDRLARHLGLSFQLQHPNVAVRLAASDALVDFSREPSDIAIRDGRGTWPGLRAHLLMKMTFTPMLSLELAASIGGVGRRPIFSNFGSSMPADPWWAPNGSSRRSSRTLACKARTWEREA